MEVPNDMSIRLRGVVVKNIRERSTALGSNFAGEQSISINPTLSNQTVYKYTKSVCDGTLKRAQFLTVPHLLLTGVRNYTLREYMKAGGVTHVCIDCCRLHGYSLYGYSLYGYSLYGYIVYGYSVYGYSLYGYSVYGYSIVWL